MRNRFAVLISVLAIVFGWFAYAQVTQPERLTIIITPFADTYQLQQTTGIDFDYGPEGQFPGQGASHDHADVMLKINGLEILCKDTQISIISRESLVRQGDIYCPLADHTDVATATGKIQDLIDTINSSNEWYLDKDHTEGKHWKANYGTEISDAFHYLAHESDQDYGVASIPLFSWRSDIDRASLHLDAAIHYRDGDDRLRYSLSYLVVNNCFTDIAVYAGGSKRGTLDQPEYQEVAHLREYFGHRIYEEIPWAERVALTHKYVTEMCENTATW